MKRYRVPKGGEKLALVWGKIDFIESLFEINPTLVFVLKKIFSFCPIVLKHFRRHDHWSKVTFPSGNLPKQDNGIARFLSYNKIKMVPLETYITPVS